jgi:hypothetical protein
MDKVFKFPEGTMTILEWVANYADRVEEYYPNWRSLINKKKWNSLGGGDQEKYEKALQVKAQTPKYRAWKGEVFYDLTKAEYVQAKIQLD